MERRALREGDSAAGLGGLQLVARQGWETSLATKASTCQLDLEDVGL